VDTSPRITGLNSLPASITEQAPPATLPFQPSPSGQAITWGLDDKLKTPYSHNLDASWSRELPGDFVLQVSYVGRLGHRLLQQLDFAMPTNLRDPKSGTTYFQAAQQFAQMARQGTAVASVQPAPYWENLFANAAGPASAQL
jgi:hypothetical protein